MIKTTRFFTVVFVVVLLVIYSFLSAPDWLDRIQVFQMSKGYFFNPSPNLSKVLFTGHGWGIYFPNLLVDYSIQNEIDAWHNNNGPYMTMGATTILFMDTTIQIEVPVSHRMQDINGHEVDQFGSKRYTLASSAWRTFVKSAKPKGNRSRSGRHTV